ncbi:MAG: LysE family translocator [Flavobacteriales bacterium]|nr:LysE family translocator [Flavobacteriales bacterium]
MIAALLGLVLGFLGSMPVAGPIALLVVRKGVKEEYDEGAAIALGASVPEAVYCGLALFGFDFLFERYPIVESASQVLGGILLLVLGIGFMLMKPREEDLKTLLPKKGRWAAPFMTGFTVAAFNPTLMVTWSGVAAVLYAMMGAFTELEMIAFPIGVGLGNFLWFAVLLSLMQRHRARFSQRAIVSAIRVIGAAIVLLGLWMLANSSLRLIP